MRRTSIALLLLLASLLPSSVARAVEPAARAVEPAARASKFTYSASTTVQSLFAADMASGGSVASQRLGFSAGVNWRPAPAFSAGVGLNYEAQDWTFESGPAFGTTPPWSALERGSVSLPLGLALSPHFFTGLSPFAEWSYEREAGASDALTYGASLSAFGIISPRFSLGGGAKLHHQYFRTKVTPFLIVNWQLSTKLRIANSQAAGPLGSGGVELRYAPAPKWEMSIGGVTRSDRFRLEPEGTPAGDLAEQGGIPAYARVSYGVGTRLRADAYAGMLANARLKRWNDAGTELVDEEVAAAPAVALVLSSRW
jgi:hypothetical protein